MFGDLPGRIGSGGDRISQFDRGQRAYCMSFGHRLTVYAHRDNSAGFAGSPAFWWFTMGHMSDFETFNVDEVPENAHILDVREPYEFDAGHIPGAINIPMEQLPIRIEELDPDTDYYVICRTGGRSARATPYMEMHGYSAVNVAGGCGAWLEADLPLVSENGSEPVVR